MRTIFYLVSAVFSIMLVVLSFNGADTETTHRIFVSGMLCLIAAQTSDIGKSNG